MSFMWVDRDLGGDIRLSLPSRWRLTALITKVFCHTMPTSLGYLPVHIADTTPDIHLIIIAVTRAIGPTTMVDPIVMADELTATTVGRIGTIGTETDLIETIGDTVTTEDTVTIEDTARIEDTTTITSIIAMMILTTTMGGVDLGIAPDATVVDITTTWKIMRADFP